MFTVIYQCPDIGHDAERGTIEHTVKTAIRIQYGWGSINKLKTLCTDSMANRSDLRNFRVAFKPYFIDEHEGFSYYNDSTKSSITLSVHVYSPDLRIHVFSLSKEDDGIYRISNIEHDI